MLKDFEMVLHEFNEPITITVISMTSWLNYGGYALRKMLLPSHVAEPQKLKLAMNQDKKRIEVIW